MSVPLIFMFAGMAGGQQADISFQTKNFTSKDVYWIQEKKTGSLIGSICG